MAGTGQSVRAANPTESEPASGSPRVRGTRARRPADAIATVSRIVGSRS